MLDYNFLWNVPKSSQIYKIISDQSKNVNIVYNFYSTQNIKIKILKLVIVKRMCPKFNYWYKKAKDCENFLNFGLNKARVFLKRLLAFFPRVGEDKKYSYIIHIGVIAPVLGANNCGHNYHL